MECTHGHHHSHHHHHHDGLAEGLSSDNAQRLKKVLILSAIYLLLQFVGGYFSGSLALMAEAGHKVGDTLSVGLALVAAWLATLPASNKRTFGFGRMEILVALANGLLLIFISTEILQEAFHRMQGHDHHHHAINSGLMLLVACIGLAINVISVKVLHPSREKNLNIKGAYLHVMTDLIGSVGTIISSLLIWLTHWQWVDLALSAIIAILVFSNAFRILAEALHVLMEAAPSKLDMAGLERFLLGLPHVVGIHDLHVWTITTGKDALLVHVNVAQEAFSYVTMSYIEGQLRKRYGFCHITVQLEPIGFQEQTPPF